MGYYHLVVAAGMVPVAFVFVSIISVMRSSLNARTLDILVGVDDSREVDFSGLKLLLQLRDDPAGDGSASS